MYTQNMFQSHHSSWQSTPTGQDQPTIPCAHCDALVSVSFNYCNSCGAPMIRPANSFVMMNRQHQHSSSMQMINNSGGYGVDHFDETKSHAQKDDVCKFYAQGKCRHGSHCKFIHEIHTPDHSPNRDKGMFRLGPQSGVSSSVPTEATTCRSIGDISAPSSHLAVSLFGPSSQKITEESYIDDQMILRAIGSLGLIASEESFSTVSILLHTLRSQCNAFDPTAANKARSALKALISVNNEHETHSSTPILAAEGAPSRNLYVHGFGPETDETCVEALFSLFCEVKCVVMKEVLSRTTGEVEGRYCFVWTSCLQQATKARNALDKFNLNGSLLQVSFAKERNNSEDAPTSLRKLSSDHSPNRHAGDGVSPQVSMNSPALNPPSRNLFVANLSETTNSDDIEMLFSRFCEVKRVVMKSAGYCFVWTGGVQQAVSTISALNGYDLKGHCIQLAFAKEKESSKK